MWTLAATSCDRKTLNRHQAERLPSVRRHAKPHLHLGRFQQLVIEGLLQLLNEVFARFHGLQQLPDMFVRDRPSALWPSTKSRQAWWATVLSQPRKLLLGS